MKRTGGWSALLLAALAIGCSQDTADVAIDEDVEDRTPYERLENTADTAQGYGAAEAAPVTPVQGGATVGGPLTMTGQFEAIAEGAPPGSVTLTEVGEGTRVLIQIHRYTAGTTLAATLTEGTCDARGEIVEPIGEPFTVSPQGIATLDARIPVRTQNLMAGVYSVRLNTPGRGAPEMVLACANLPVNR